MGGLTIENNFFILKIEKRNKIIVFDLFLSRDFAYFIQYLLHFIGRPQTRSVQIQICKKRRDYNFSIENTTLK